MGRPRAWLALAAVLALVIGVLVWRLLSGANATHDLVAPRDIEEVTTAIEGAVPAARRDAEVPVVVVGVGQGEDLRWTEGFGTPEDTVFQAGSISKPVAAAAVLSLVEDGLVDLDTPVSSYLTTWRLPGDFPNPDAVTLRALLSHTAGIDTSGYLGIPEDRPLPDTAASLGGATTGEAVRQNGKVGTYSYSGGGYTIVQKVVEDATREDFTDVVRRTVLAPLGMTRSGYGCTQRDRPAPGEAPGHRDDASAAPRYRYPEAAAAGLCSTGADLLRFAMWLGSADPRAVDMRSAADGTDGRHGLGVEIGTGDTVRHLGVNRGFHAELLVNPVAQVGLVVLTNGDRGGEVIDAVLQAWHDAS